MAASDSGAFPAWSLALPLPGRASGCRECRCPIFEWTAEGIWNTDITGSWEELDVALILPDDLVRLDIVEDEPADVAEAKVPVIDDAMVERASRRDYEYYPGHAAGEWDRILAEDVVTARRCRARVRAVLEAALGGESNV
ncbi:hypothetical protein [Microbacterium sp. No. 7]|uniref:hypothetical protein n=1 Tax=Microbacterium sp. No. 7 TaxID=1714373 RepID=UPI0006D23975